MHRDPLTSNFLSLIVCCFHGDRCKHGPHGFARDAHKVTEIDKADTTLNYDSYEATQRWGRTIGWRIINHEVVPDKGFHGHVTSLELSVNQEVNRMFALSGIILVDEDRVACDVTSGRIPKSKT